MKRTFSFFRKPYQIQSATRKLLIGWLDSCHSDPPAELEIILPAASRALQPHLVNEDGEAVVVRGKVELDVAEQRPRQVPAEHVRSVPQVDLLLAGPAAAQVRDVDVSGGGLGGRQGGLDQGLACLTP